MTSALDYWEYHINQAKELLEKAEMVSRVDITTCKDGEWALRAVGHALVGLALKLQDKSDIDR